MQENFPRTNNLGLGSDRRTYVLVRANSSLSVADWRNKHSTKSKANCALGAANRWSLVTTIPRGSVTVVMCYKKYAGFRWCLQNYFLSFEINIFHSEDNCIATIPVLKSSMPRINLPLCATCAVSNHVNWNEGNSIASNNESFNPS